MNRLDAYSDSFPQRPPDPFTIRLTGVRPMKVAILDDYQDVALRLADWSGVARRAKIRAFNDHVADPAALVERLLRPFTSGSAMR